MASGSIAPADFSKLGDLRKKYADDELAQNYALTSQFPQKHKMHRHSSGGGGGRQGGINGKEINSLDAVIVTARHLLSLVDMNVRKVGDHNLFVSMLWADLDDPSGYEDQHRARVAILNRFREANPGRPINFLTLTENRNMWETFWRMYPFQLWHWGVLAGGEDPAGWRLAEKEDETEIIKQSLISYDGNGDLGDHITGQFGTFRDEDTGIYQHWQGNCPCVIRVHYHRESEDDEVKGWDQLREIKIRQYRIQHLADENGDAMIRYDSTGGPLYSYNLVAVVRIGNMPEEADRIRLYSIDGQNVHLPNDAMAYAGTQWRLGEGRDRYLLYYAPQPPRMPSGGVREEITLRRPGVRSKIEAARKAVILKPRGDSVQSVAVTVKPRGDLVQSVARPGQVPAGPTGPTGPTGPASPMASNPLNVPNAPNAPNVPNAFDMALTRADSLQNQVGPSYPPVGGQPSATTRSQGFIRTPPRAPRALAASFGGHGHIGSGEFSRPSGPRFGGIPRGPRGPSRFHWPGFRPGSNRGDRGGRGGRGGREPSGA